MRAKRVDENQTAIVAGFRKSGCSVIHLHSVGGGCPDLAVGYAGITALVEIKAGKGRFTKAQQESEWTGGIQIARTQEDVIRIAELLKRWHTWITQASLDQPCSCK